VSGGVGGGSREVSPYPDSNFFTRDFQLNHAYILIESP
jgi:hypothetical protein